jgi:hypothetical protein
MSVNKKVTVPEGRSTTRSSHPTAAPARVNKVTGRAEVLHPDGRDGDGLRLATDCLYGLDTADPGH